MREKTCLVVIDVQNGIFRLKQPVYNSASFLRTLREMIVAAKMHSVSIIYTQHENDTFLSRNSENWKIVDGIGPVDHDAFIIQKKRPGIFDDTGLIDFLHREKITTLCIAGLISNGCIREACLDGLKNGFRIVLVADAHGTFYKNAEKIIEKINNEMRSQGVEIKQSMELW
ncbi:MAG: cysteine hydrolase [Chitinispirillaceae bacterium]|nr:cysteine hydrolase [Chitinispirillaceae bacterium]